MITNICFAIIDASLAYTCFVRGNYAWGTVYSAMCVTFVVLAVVNGCFRKWL